MDTESTPRTDSKSSGHIGYWLCATVPSSFARELERELRRLTNSHAFLLAALKEIQAHLYTPQDMARCRGLAEDAIKQAKSYEQD